GRIFSAPVQEPRLATARADDARRTPAMAGVVAHPRRRGTDAAPARATRERRDLAAPCEAASHRAAAHVRRTQLQPGYLFVAPWDVTDVGGVNQVILNLSRLMREGGTYVPKIVVASWTGAASPVNLRNGVPVSRMRLRAPLMPGAPVRSAIKWAATLVPDLVRLARCLRNDEIATVNVHYPSLAALQIVLARVL